MINMLIWVQRKLQHNKIVIGKENTPIFGDLLMQNITVGIFFHILVVP